jgi:murein DD-endopeptidase MepM/ murein hydrolase activator NlpD
MKYQIIEKYAQENLVIQILRGWKDPQGNISLLVNASGKKFGLVRLKGSDDWMYWLGFGASKKTVDMPAGRGDYIVGQPVEEEISSKINPIVDAGLNLENIDTRLSFWAPYNNSEVMSLANLVKRLSDINLYLSQNGISYAGSDKVEHNLDIIYGENLSAEDVLKFKPKPRSVTPDEHLVGYQDVPPKGGADIPPAPKATTGPVKKDDSSLAQNSVSKTGKASGIFGSNSPKWITNNVGNGYQVGPQHHMGRSQSRADRYKADPEKNWYSDNAWDVLNPAGTQIYSLTDGKVTSVRESSSSAVNIYGTQIIVAGDNGYPDVFYTHTDNLSVSPGDVVKVGDPIAKICQPKTDKMPHHVHVGLPPGVQMSSLMSENGQFKSKSSLIS